jgi:hypothetical protein
MQSGGTPLLSRFFQQCQDVWIAGWFVIDKALIPLPMN